MHSVAARAFLAIAIVLPLAVASIHSVCNAYFDCGCAPLWSGGADHCDIHDPGPPDCPWCTGDRFYFVTSLCLGGIAGGAAAGARLSTRIFPAILLALLGYLLATWIASLSPVFG